MHIFATSLCLWLVAVSLANAETEKFKPATEAQILKHMKGSSELTKARNGFSYKAGGNIGYKISHGKICVLGTRRNVDCVTVRTNGNNFQMIDRKGNRENF